MEVGGPSPVSKSLGRFAKINLNNAPFAGAHSLQVNYVVCVSEYQTLQADRGKSSKFAFLLSLDSLSCDLPILQIGPGPGAN